MRVGAGESSGLVRLVQVIHDLILRAFLDDFDTEGVLGLVASAEEAVLDASDAPFLVLGKGAV